MFCKKGVLRNFAKRPATLLKKRLCRRCFPVDFAKFLGTSFLQSTSRRLLLSQVLFQAFLFLLLVKRLRIVYDHQTNFRCSVYTSVFILGRREVGGQGGSNPPPFSWSKIVFPLKIGNHKIFTGEEYKRLEFIYWARHKWPKVDSFFWICRFSSKLSYHSYQERVCKVMFLTRTFVKTFSNLMCGSFLLM